MAERRNKTLRDMSLSMGLIVAAVLVIVGLYGGFSVSPAGPSGGQTPTADVQDGFARADRTVKFPVVPPVGVPSNWHPNSFSMTAATDPADSGSGGASTGPPAVRGGWIIPDGAFITLVESSGSIPAVLKAEVGIAGPATGSVQAGGTTWTITPGVRSERAWVRQSAGVTFLITGGAGQDAFASLAAAVAGH